MDPHRLPSNVVPTHYTLRLTPDLEAGTFRGMAKITVNVLEPTREILLNAVELQILVAISESGERPVVVSEPNEERVRLVFRVTIPPGITTLILYYLGTLNDRLRGFYRCRYRHPSGEERWLAATQFEATDARRAFPCWDEPAFKATFGVRLRLDPELQAISNTSIIEDKIDSGGFRYLRFADTISMSTYLVAFLIGEFEADDAVPVGRTPLRVWSVPGKKQLTRFGRDIAASSLAFFEEYYDLPYPGDKLDLIAVPDFAAGAMENFGAITFRETALLVDDANATHQERERVADVVAHENAHMWFGDLVTMRWWNGLWLNEAFATFMQMLAVDAWKPEWRRWETFAVSRAGALVVDGLHSSRPVEFPVLAPADAEAMFDVLTYDKGAAVLRMWERHLGELVFRDGVRAYLKKHAYGNTETDDLWRALEAASGQPLVAALRGWIFEAGYPLVTARRERGELVLSQRRFRYLPDSEASPTWSVPVTYSLDGETQRVLLDGPELRLPLPLGTRLPVLLNAGGHGFYRVSYSDELRAKLLNRLTSLSAVERFNLVNDAWAGVLAGHAPLTDYLDLTTRFVGEDDRNVWSVLLSSFTVLTRIVEEKDISRLRSLVRDRLAPVVSWLGWERRPGEDELTGQLRADLLRAAGTLGDDAAVQTEAARVFAAGRADAGVMSAAVAVLAHTGNEARFDEFLARFRSAATPQEESRYLMALANFRPAALVDRALKASLDGTSRAQDAPQLIRALLLNIHGREKAWAFVRERWGEMATRFAGPGVRRLCEGVLGLTSPSWLGEAEAFFRERSVALGGKAVEQILEQLRVMVELRKREGRALSDYLRR